MEWYSAYHMVIPFFTVFGNKGKYEGYSAHDYQYLIYCSHYLVDIGSDWYFRGNLFDAICKARKTCSRNSFYHRSSFRHSIYHIWSVRLYGILYFVQTANIYHCRLLNYGHLCASDYHSYNRGSFTGSSGFL